jgi:hypothetical protein
MEKSMNQINQDPMAIIKEEMQRAVIFNWMEANRVAELIVRFNGEGDNGDFDKYVSITPMDEKIGLEKYGLIQDSMMKETLQGSHKSVRDLVLHLSEKIEAEHNHSIDWVNNDGGQGQIVWILDGKAEDGCHYKRGIYMRIEARVISYESEDFSICGNIEEEKFDE